MKQHRTCSKCHLPIQKTHRWRTVYHRFLFWTWQTTEHRNCQNPEINPNNPYAVKRLKGEVPLPFMDYEEHA